MNPIETALDELYGALTKFVHLLEQEFEALQDIHAEALSQVVAEKTLWSQAANMAWNRLVVATGIDTRRGDSLETALAGYPGLQAIWQKVRQLAETAESINQGNSILIESQMRRTRNALDVLQNAANRGTLYDANGLLVETYKSPHSLDKA
jgi:flagellar biosynthesis/type III secretory pathway chaperone